MFVINHKYNAYWLRYYTVSLAVGIILFTLELYSIMTTALTFDNILMNVAIPVLVVDVDTGVIHHCNNCFKAIFADTHIDPVGKSVLDLHLWKNKDDRDRMIEKLKKHGSLCNYSAVFNDRHGHDRICTLNVNFLDDSQKYIVTTVIDVSTQIWQEEKYCKLYDKYRMLLDSTKTGYVILDDNLIVQECNDVASDIICENAQIVVGEKFINMLRSSDDATRKDLVFKLHSMTGSTSPQLLQNVELSFGDSHQYRWARANISTFGDNKIVILLNDISDVKVAESRKFIVAEKEKDKIRQGLMMLRQEIHSMGNNYREEPSPVMVPRHHLEPVVHYD